MTARNNYEPQGDGRHDREATAFLIDGYWPTNPEMKAITKFAKARAELLQYMEHRMKAIQAMTFEQFMENRKR